MSEQESNAKLALQTLFSQAMQLSPHDTVLLFLDSRTYQLYRPACDAASELGLAFFVAFYPVHLQKGFVPPLAPIYQQACQGAQGVVTILTEAPLCTRFRIAIITTALKSQCKVVHMPGVDLSILAASANISYKELSSLAATYRDALARGREVEILTRDSTRKKHRLAFSIVAREAHADGGHVGPGEIMNFPTGEAYIAPVEDSANGSIVVNGSIPDGVLGDREIILQFRGGKMVPTQTAGTAKTQISELLRSLEDTSRSDGGNSYFLGEFGIGCNPAYSKVTGRQVVDEKIAGTVHIALGANKVFGGAIEADTHLDLILWPVSVLLDGKRVLLPTRGAR